MIALLALGCGRPPAPERRPPPPPPAERPAAPPPPRAPAPPVAQQPKPSGLYALDEAVADVLSGPLTYLGTGPWTGNQRFKACAYRNERVLVVDGYCTIKEAKAFKVEVFSPTRGRVRLYAEAKAPISTITRRHYFTFTGGSEPPPRARTRLPPVTLTMSFPELLAYDQRRYQAFPPSCFGGVEVHKRQGGCLGELAGRRTEWAKTNQPFLKEPPAAWYRIISDLRAQARQHGFDPR